MRSRSVNVPTWERLTDYNVIVSVSAAGKRWFRSGYGAGEIVEEYLNGFTKSSRFVKFQNLSGSSADKLEAALRRRGESGAAAMGMSETTESAEDRSAMEAEMALDIGRAVLYGRTGDRQLTLPGVYVLRSLIGGIPSWVRCVLSRNDVEVLRLFGPEAAETFSLDRRLVQYLTIKYDYNPEPVLKCLSR